MKLQNVTTLHPGCSAADKKKKILQRVIKPAEKMAGSGLLLQSKRLQKQDTTQEFYVRVTKDRSHSALTV